MKALLIITAFVGLIAVAYFGRSQGIAGRDLPPFRYPSNMTNYYWDLEKSSNAVNWVAVAKNLKGRPTGPMPYQLQPGEQQQGKMYFRMRGHRNIE